jgi:hypothetical protein
MKPHAKVKPTGRFSRQTLFLAAVILLCAAVLGVFAISQFRWDGNPIDGRRAYDYLKQLCALGPRRSGSPAMTAQQKLLIEHFKKLGGKVELQKFDATNPADGSPVPMTNIIVRWNPQYENRILLCGHYDTLPFPLRDPVNRRGVFVGANDNGSGIAVLMELAHHVAAMRLPFGVDFVLFDGEEFIFKEDDPFFLGSEYFARQYAAGHAGYRYRYAVLLDMVGAADLQIYQEKYSVSWDDTRPLVDQIWATAARLGVGEFIAVPEYWIRDDHEPLHQIAGIPACDVIDFDYSPWHTQGDTPDKCSASSLAKVGWVMYAWLKGLEHEQGMKDKG